MFNRITKARESLKKKNLDALLVSNYYNVLYLTGFAPFSPEVREAYVLVTGKNLYLFTDRRYLNTSSKLKVQSSKLVLKFIDYKNSLTAHLEEIIKSEGIKSLGFEADDLKFNEHQALNEKLSLKDLVSTEKILLNLRSVKEEEEIENIEKACRFTDNCFREISKMIKAGMSEKELLFLIENFIKQKGFGLAFEPFIVAVGKNTSVPHYNTRSGNGKINKNSFVLVDLGASFNGYRSDATRMFFVGKQTDEVINTYNSLLKIQMRTIKKLEETAELREVDEFCRSEFAKNNLPSYPHSTGHGVGLEIHELPKISPNSDDKAKDSQIITVEPGVYFEDKWGLRVEDTILMKNGKAEVLTKFSKEIRII